MADAPIIAAATTEEEASGVREETGLPISPSAYRQVPLCEIDGDPYNVRSQLGDVRKLAASIHRYGLLENIVVVEVVPRVDSWTTLGTDANGNTVTREVRFEVRAGSRRFAALEMLMLQGHIAPSFPVPVVVLNSTGIFENITENIEREDVAPWDIGRRLNELCSAGMTSRQIGDKIKHSAGWVCRYQRIASGLAPEAIEYIKTHKVRYIVGDLYRWAHILNSHGEPDGDAQIKQIQTKRHRAQVHKRPDSWRALNNRIHYLEKQAVLPAVLQPIVREVCKYIVSGGSVNFRQFEVELLQHIDRKVTAELARRVG